MHSTRVADRAAYTIRSASFLSIRRKVVRSNTRIYTYTYSVRMDTYIYNMLFVHRYTYAYILYGKRSGARLETRSPENLSRSRADNVEKLMYRNRIRQRPTVH